MIVPNVYIGFVGIERYDDQRFKNDELNAWIEENVERQYRNYAKWGISRPPYLAGIYLYPEQATLFRLKFGYDFL